MHEQSLGCHTDSNQAHRPRDVVAGYDILAPAPQDFSAVAVWPFDEVHKTAAVFDDLAAQRLRIGRMDLRIAAMALSRRIILATRHARDFGQGLGLQIEDGTV